MILTEIGKTRGLQLEKEEYGVMLNLMEGDTREKICSNQLKRLLCGSEEMLGLRRDLWELSA